MISCSFENGSAASLRHVVVDNIVLRGDQILLVKRNGKLLEGGKWALVGGFVERDETIKEAVAREILEETGYRVTDITLLRIVDAPARPAEDRQNIAFVHFCAAQEKIGGIDWESEEIRWFPLNALPPRNEIAFDHADSIRLYLEYREQHLPLPMVG
jgi:8-oxo-dGTP diphosphatase